MKHAATKKALKPQAQMAPIVIIGYGNSYRRDDGAGPALAEKLVDYWSTQGISARLLTSTQLMPEMADELADYDVEAVVFVDTLAQTVTQSSVTAIQIFPVALDATSPSLGHQLDPSTLLVYAALLYGRYPHAWLVTIPGIDFTHGQGFSKEVNQWLSDVPAIADQLLTEMKECELCTNLPLPNV